MAISIEKAPQRELVPSRNNDKDNDSIGLIFVLEHSYS